MISKTDIKLVQNSWELVKPIAPAAAEIFYSKLFELDPSAKALFKSDMNKQGQKLMQMIGFAVDQLNTIESIVKDIEAMGRRHVGYGVKDDQYATVGEALIYTLKTGLKDSFTKETESAWIEVYTLLSQTMINAK